MKYLILSIITLVMCSGCLTSICIKEINKQGEKQTNIVLTDQLTAGLSENKKTIILKNSHQTSYRLDKISGRRYQVQMDDIPLIDKDIPAFGVGEKPKTRDKSYINIKEQNDMHLVLDMKLVGEGPKEIFVEQYSNKDPLYLKRTGLVLVTPITVGLDVAFVASGVGLGTALYILSLPL